MLSLPRKLQTDLDLPGCRESSPYISYAHVLSRYMGGFCMVWVLDDPMLETAGVFCFACGFSGGIPRLGPLPLPSESCRSLSKRSKERGEV